MSRRPLLALYAVAHFWVDLSCAFLIFRTLSGTAELAEFEYCLLVYNFCAFALQMPLGLLAGRFNRNSLVSAAGCGLVALAYGLPWPMASAAAAGIGNALFHLGGGIDTLNTGGNKAASLGVFVSPGAVGLFLGTLWGKGTTVEPWIILIGLLGLGLELVWLGKRTFGSLQSENPPLDLTLSDNWLVLASLFLVVVLRSYVGMNQSFAWKSGIWTVLVALALAAGKGAGGFTMDIFGGRRAAAGSLGLAAFCYLFSSELPILGTLAVFLFNMTMPMTLWAAAKTIPGAKGFTFGLLTFGLFLGYLPLWLGWPSVLTTPESLALASLISLGLLWVPLERGECRAAHFGSLTGTDTHL